MTKIDDDIEEELISKWLSNTNTKRLIIIISGVLSGGSNKFIVDMVNNLGNDYVSVIRLSKICQLDYYRNIISDSDYIICNHFIDTDIRIEDVLKFKKDTGVNLYIFVHDFILLSNEENIYKWSDEYTIHSSDKSEMSDIVKLFFEESDKILYNSNFTKNVFSKFGFDNKSSIVQFIDIGVKYEYQNIPPIESTINIGIINNVTITKGFDIYPQIFNILEYNGCKITYHIFGNVSVDNENVLNHGEYNENEIFSLLEENKIHGLLFFNKYPETYSYALSKGINSGLPIQYTNIGAYTERLSGYEKYFPCNGDEVLVFKYFLDYILKSKNYGIKPSNELIVSTDIYNLFKKKLELYAIYFPQHIPIRENDKTFYEGYHDMKNLEFIYNDSPNVLIPDRGFYSLDNDVIIKEHVEQAKSYNISGFGIYWYWFDVNTITGNNKILDSVINRFFKNNFDDFDVFLIWANESWSNNIAFNQNNNGERIENTYSNDSFKKCFKSLLEYFKHNNYKKINNKPLFYIHHPWEIKNIEVFIEMLNNECISHGFDGVDIRLNDIMTPDKNCYSHSPNYKNLDNTYMKTIDGFNVIDYEEYIKYEIGRGDGVKVLFQNFDNSARFYRHKNKDKIITKTINNSEENFKKMIWVQTCSYQKSGIYILNAWNEWGEGLCFEPSDKNGDRLLKVLGDMLYDNKTL